MTTAEPTPEEQRVIDNKFLNAEIRRGAARRSWRSVAEIPAGNQEMNDALRGRSKTEEKDGNDAA
jgi:hypothetical protein